MRKYLWVDVETTGLDPKINAPHQVAGEVVIDGISVETFNLKFCPREGAVIEPEALLKTFPDLTPKQAVDKVMSRKMLSKNAYSEFNYMMTRRVNKYDKDDKMVFCAYNAHFDAQFISDWYKGHGNKYFFGLCHGGAYFDPLTLALLVEMKAGKRIFKPNRKLATVCAHFGVDLSKAHDAEFDIKATREVGQILWKRLMGHDK